MPVLSALRDGGLRLSQRFCTWVAVGQSVAVGLLIVGMGDRTIAAETVTLRYGTTTTTVSMADLQTFGTQGESSQALSDFFSQIQLPPDRAQGLMTQAFPISPSFVERNFRGLTAEFVLIQLDKLIGLPPRRGEVTALQDALASAYVDDFQLSILEIIEEYPGATVQVDLGSLETVYQDVNLYITRIQPVITIVSTLLPELVCECELPETRSSGAFPGQPSQLVLSSDLLIAGLDVNEFDCSQALVLTAGDRSQP